MNTSNLDSIVTDNPNTQGSTLGNTVIPGKDGQPKINLLIDRLKSKENDK